MSVLKSSTNPLSDVGIRIQPDPGIRQYEVPAALARLESGIELAHALTTDLAARLESALAPVSDDIKTQGIRVGAASPLGDRIGVDADRLSTLTDRLGDLLRRIEL